MSLNRHAAKRDDNEGGIVAMWEALGAYAEPLSGTGNPDHLVHFDGHIFRAEVKGGKKGLTPAQVEAFMKAHLAGVPTYVIRSKADAVMLLETTLEPWLPEQGALARAARKARQHCPGKSKARSLAEACAVDFCSTSRATGSTRCAVHKESEP